MATFAANVSGVKLLVIPLSANLTNITLTGAFDGQEITLEFQQNSTGGYTVTSATIPSLAQPSAAANAESFQQFIWNAQTNLWVLPNAAGAGAASGGITQTITASGALTAATGYVTLGGAGVDAMTLVAPPSDGIVMTFLVITAHAHTITTPANKIAGGFDTVTFGTTLGNGITLTSSGGLWYASAAQGATLSEV